MLEALCRQSSTTLDIVHAEDGPPITQRTSGLERSMHSAEQPANTECNESSRIGLFLNELSGNIADGTNQF
jgi:hypothetical protein